MKNKLHTITLALFFITGMILSLGMVSADSHQAPDRGHHIWGELQVNGEDAPDETVVEARLDGDVLQSTTTNDSIYSFTISDNQNNNRDGETITIYVEDVEGESVTFQNSEISNVSFSVDGVTFGDQEDDSGDDGSSGSSGGSSGSSGGSGGLGVASADENETEETNTSESSTEETSLQDSNSDSNNDNQGTEGSTDSDDTVAGVGQEQQSDTETTQRTGEDGSSVLTAMTGFVTGVGDQAGLTGGLFLILILTGLVGGYIYYNSKE